MRQDGWRGRGRATVLLLFSLLWAGPMPRPGVRRDRLGQRAGRAGPGRRAGAGPRRAPLAVGTEVFEGDRIRTAADARLRLSLEDGSVLTLGAATDLDLGRFRYLPQQAARDVLLEVPRGIIRILVELLVAHSTFEVQTHTAVASVRGTDWIAEAGPDATAIVALGGRVGVRSADPAQAGEVVLFTGEGTTVEAGAPPQAKTTWGEARKSAFIERTRLP